jgi:hypothetical protein
MNSGSISALLQESLELIDDSSNYPNDKSIKSDPKLQVPSMSTAVSASMQLLHDRKRLKRSIEAEDFVAFDPNKKPNTTNISAVGNAYLDQVASSQVDQPKYWKTNKTPVRRSNQNKAKTLLRSKGADYKERYSSKVQSRIHKSLTKKKLKSE